MHKKVFQSAVVALALFLAACGAAQTATQPGAPTNQSAGGMGHGAAGDHGSTPTSSAAYDAQFIDSMIAHHQGAIDMANQALKEAERPEIKELAANIVKAQEGEISQMREWRKQWYPDLADTGGMGMAMGKMSISSDTAKPFDQRFIEAMIPHHQSAVEMARDAQQKAEHQEIKTLAGNIISDQEKEIAQMQQWLKDWFGK